MADTLVAILMARQTAEESSNQGLLKACCDALSSGIEWQVQRVYYQRFGEECRTEDRVEARGLADTVIDVPVVRDTGWQCIMIPLGSSHQQALDYLLRHLLTRRLNLDDVDELEVSDNKVWFTLHPEEDK
jgi:hypothetical protein